MTEVSEWAVKMTEEVIGETPFNIGDRVHTQDSRIVEIVSGQYWGTYGISNFWEWREVLPSGELSKKLEQGYGKVDNGGKLNTRQK